MPVSATRTITLEFTGDVVAEQVLVTNNPLISPGQIDVVNLASGANTITPPLGGSTPIGVIIVPPAGNAFTITLKGVTGDTGVVLHTTHPTSISLNSPTATFVLTASGIITGVRLIWF